jgi:hypothetical protein
MPSGAGEFEMRNVIRNSAVVFSCIVAILATSAALAGGTFLKSDDHGNELVGKFLTDQDYGVMIDNLERNGVEFDWGWVKTPDGKLKKPKVLGFDLASYKTVSVPAVQDFSDSLSPELAAKVHEAFVRAVKGLGLEVAADGDKSAGLELGVAIIDLKRERTYAYVAMIDPFIKLEIRLKDAKTGENLLLVRNRSHSETPESAALKMASQMMKFLR